MLIVELLTEGIDLLCEEFLVHFLELGYVVEVEVLVIVGVFHLLLDVLLEASKHGLKDWISLMVWLGTLY